MLLEGKPSEGDSSGHGLVGDFMEEVLAQECKITAFLCLHNLVACIHEKQELSRKSEPLLQAFESVCSLVIKNSCQLILNQMTGNRSLELWKDA